MSEPRFDPRIFPYRDDIAADFLEGQVEARRFVAGEPARVTAGVLALREHACATARLGSELLFGEDFIIYERNGDWAWGQNQIDGYVGYALAAGLGAPGPPATHEVAALRTYLFGQPDLKSPPLQTLHMTTRLAVLGQAHGFAEIAGGGWAHGGHLVRLGQVETDFVAVARRFLGAPYLWGGRSSFGLDCSALTQLALARTGRFAPRDSDMQQAALGQPVDGGLEAALPGDLLYMKGHCMILAAPGRLLHANAYHMAVAEEPLADFLVRLDAMGGRITEVRRV